MIVVQWCVLVCFQRGPGSAEQDCGGRQDQLQRPWRGDPKTLGRRHHGQQVTGQGCKDGKDQGQRTGTKNGHLTRPL